MSKFLEIDIENYIWNLIKSDQLSTEKLHLEDARYFRQYKIEGVGVLDILAINIERLYFGPGNIRTKINVRIFELKRAAIKCEDVGQICRYIDFVNSNKKALIRQLNLNEDCEIDANGVLIGRGVEKDAGHLIRVLFPNVSLWTFDFSLQNGIEFNQRATHRFNGMHRENQTPSLIVPNLMNLRKYRAIELFDMRAFERNTFQEN